MLPWLRLTVPMVPWPDRTTLVAPKFTAPLWDAPEGMMSVPALRFVAAWVLEALLRVREPAPFLSILPAPLITPEIVTDPCCEETCILAFRVTWWS